jgi:uncharacterized protein YbaP (TraB family)
MAIIQAKFSRFYSLQSLVVAVFFLLFVSSTLNAAPLSNNAKKSFLWKIEHDQAIVYLFGSIHLANKHFYPLNQTIENAFASASKLVVEVDIEASEPQLMQKEILRRGTYHNGDTIRSHVNQETFAQLAKFCTELNIPINSVIKLKPGILAMTLSAAYFSRLGYSAKYGLDNHFINEARNHKPILELETIEEQLNLLLHETNNELFLAQTLSSLNKSENELYDLINAWKNGEAETMNRLIMLEPLKESPELLPVYQKLFFDRNKKMSNKIIRFLNTNEIYFVVVGAGHLIGEQGIIKILRRNKFIADQI